MGMGVNWNEFIEMGGIWYEKSIPAHLLFPLVINTILPLIS